MRLEAPDPALLLGIRHSLDQLYRDRLIARIERLFLTSNIRSWWTCDMQCCSRRAAFLRRSRRTAGRRHVLRARHRDDRRRPQQRPHHRDRHGQGSRRRVPRHAAEPDQSGSGDPADDHRAHRHHRVDGGAGAGDRCRASGDDRVPGRCRGRRAQRRVRHGLHQCRPVQAWRSGDHEPGHRHLAVGPAPHPRRGARLPARHLGIALSSRSPAVTPRTRRCPGHHRPAALLARACRRPRCVGARRPHRAAPNRLLIHRPPSCA